jgi:hypothetical protein
MSIQRDGITINEDGFKSRETLRDECKGEIIMDTDFIKWMCEKAEGFELYLEKFDNTILEGHTWVKFNDGTACSLDFMYRDIFKRPLLFQRAIEGVNREGFYEIVQYCNRIEVYQIDNASDIDTFLFGGNVSEAKAKESSLKYIYEQEKK